MLNELEKDKLKNGILAAMSIPLIDDIEDFIWEAIFAYAKDLEIPDPLSHIRSKLLFDVTDKKNGIGWSCKALQCTTVSECEFELVIQRADIFKKAKVLGFNSLSTKSPTDILGEALLKHWYNKINDDSKTQHVTDKRIAILVKSNDRKKFAYYEDAMSIFKPNELVWTWTDSTKTGLQGKRKKDNFCVYRWYPNQKQFFERFKLPRNVFSFEIQLTRLPLKEVINFLLNRLKDRK